MAKDNINSQEGQGAIRDLYAKFDSLSERLLTDSIKLTSQWQRSAFVVDPLKTGQIYNLIKSSSLGASLVERDGYRFDQEVGKYKNIKVDTTNPIRVAITVEKFGPHEDGSSGKEVKVAFVYLDLDNRDYYLNFFITLHAGDEISEITSCIYQPDNFETGYEGEDFKHLEADPDSLKLLYEIVEQNTKGTQIKEKTVDEQLVAEKHINMDTGATFYYDPKRKNWFTKNGICIDDDKKPLEKLSPKNAQIKPLAVYNIEELSEEEKNPFV